ncbi:MAG: DUF2797 domain-containing protein [Bacteroidetes bacterium]|nr:DUF2797 domain-containing protein [Bacteroidota bacterium]
MRLTGRIYKMESQLAEQVIYHLPVENELIPMNELVGSTISLTFQNEIYCMECGEKTRKSFQGFCWNCFSTSAENSECILRPELCLAHEGKGRDMEWEKKHHLQEHFVYLALSSEIKVGVTRSTQVPTRWIDQGASAVIRLAKVPYRYLAGVIEVEFKKHFTDKTNWQKMLKNELQNINLVEEKQKAKQFLLNELKQYFSEDDSITQLNYPVIKYPAKVKSIDFEKQNLLSGKLIGIKGQYLIMEDNSVLNVRKHNGYVVTVEF